ncbi:MAG: TonB-dependent receptor, partial [Bacteroidales bacterium]
LDHDSKTALIGATVIVLGTDPIVGTITDLDGYFRIDNVPVGRINLKISYVGYEDKIISNILLGTGKEAILSAELVETVLDMDEVMVTAKKNKTESLNEMAPVSAKAFTVEETKRYAGSINDPARMVSGFAGVTGDAQGRNEIVVRGNSPQGILWRLEGIEIPNPNHFATEGTTGGPINALNSTMLSNSDFYSGAFAPEYGNAYSGVFDIRLRNGNNEKREYSFSAGVLGTDFTAEGPFKKGNSSSYLVNYRYSTLAILDDLNLVDFQGVPKYQDASFKVVVSTDNYGVFSLFGLLGKSNIYQEDSEEGIRSEEDIVYRTNDFGADMAVVGLKNTYIINDKTYLKSAVSFSGNRYSNIYKELNDENEFYVDGYDEFTNSAAKFSLILNNKFNARNTLQTGFIYTYLSYNMFSEDFINRWDRLVRELDTDGNAGLIQSYASWKHRVNDDLTLVSGVHYTNFLLNNNYSLEPRASLKWKIKPNQTLTAGFGIHSKVGPLSRYMVTQNHEDGTEITPNKDIKMAKAMHYVVGYDHIITRNMHFKAELYYQYLYDVPVEDNENSSYSVLNAVEGWTDRSLINKGTGTNYGAEFMLERFFADDYYFLATASVYNSEYKAMDGIARDTRFNGNYAANLLAGKEFKIGKPSKGRTLSFDTKAALIGGIRYTPIDLEQSIIQEREVRQETKPFSEKGSDIFKLDISVSLRRNKKRTTRELKLEIQNVTNSQGLVTQYYNSRKKEIEDSYQLPILPVISYKIDF